MAETDKRSLAHGRSHVYKPAQASQLLNIPESTLRRLAKQFSAYLSPKPSNRREYSERDIETLARARAFLEQGLTVKQALERLAQVVIDIPQEEHTEPEPVTSSSLVVQQLTTLSKQYTTLREELESLRASREEDRARLKALEEYLSRPWFERVFRKPPKP